MTEKLHDLQIAVLGASTVSVCGRPAAERVEVYSPRGSAHGSLDASLYVCAEHHTDVRLVISAAGLTPFSVPNTTPGPKRCGDGYDFVAGGPISAPAPADPGYRVVVRDADDDSYIDLIRDGAVVLTWTFDEACRVAQQLADLFGTFTGPASLRVAADTAVGAGDRSDPVPGPATEAPRGAGLVESALMVPTSPAEVLGTGAQLLERDGWHRPGQYGGLTLSEALSCALTGHPTGSMLGLTPPQQDLLVRSQDCLEFLLMTDDLAGWEHAECRDQEQVAAALRIAAEVAGALSEDLSADAGQAWTAARIDLAHLVAGVSP